MARHNQIGLIGERIAAKYLSRRGYKVISINYRTGFGEIDIISKMDDVIIFFEVKTVSCESTDFECFIRPEENLHKNKLEKLYRTIEIYLKETGQNKNRWELQLITVKYAVSSKKALVEIVPVL